MSPKNILVMALAAFTAANAQTAAAPVNVRILVYDYAKLAGRPLTESLDQAARALRHAGIEPEWCVGIAAIDECLAAGKRSGKPALQLNLLNERMAAKTFGESRIFGIALRQDAYINVPRVQNLEQEGRFEAKMILGCVIAHELGHLLLGPNAHSRGSIMTANLGDRELAQAQYGTLRFSPNEAQRMRERLSR